jgi:voltage-gated potassium channel
MKNSIQTSEKKGTNGNNHNSQKAVNENGLLNKVYYLLFINEYQQDDKKVENDNEAENVNEGKRNKQWFKNIFYKIIHHWVDLLISTFIIISMVSLTLETMPSIHIDNILYAVEVVIALAFTIEYFLRIVSITSVKNKRKQHHSFWGMEKPRRIRDYTLSLWGIIDLISSIPSCFALLYPSLSFFIAFRGFRLLRLTRIFKLGERKTKTIDKLFKVIHDERHNLIISIALFVIMLFICSAIMFECEHDTDPNNFSSIPATLWWGIQTLTTIGYGDMLPHTILGRVFSGVISILGIGMFALPSGIIIQGLLETHKDKELEPLKKVVHELNCPHCNNPVEFHIQSNSNSHYISINKKNI